MRKQCCSSFHEVYQKKLEKCAIIVIIQIRTKERFRREP